MEKSKQLSVDGYTFEELHVTRNPVFVRDNMTLEPVVAVEFNTFTHETDNMRFAVSLCVKSQEPLTQDHPLRFSVRIIGFFRLEEPIVDRKLHGDRVVNGLTILYGIVRAHLSTATGWFDKTLLAPTIYFTDLVNAKIEAARSREIENEQQPIEARALTGG